MPCGNPILKLGHINSCILFRMDCMRLSFENDLRLTALLFLLLLLLLVELFSGEEQVSVVGAGAGDLAWPL